MCTENLVRFDLMTESLLRTRRIIAYASCGRALTPRVTKTCPPVNHRLRVSFNSAIVKVISMRANKCRPLPALRETQRQRATKRAVSPVVVAVARS